MRLNQSSSDRSKKSSFHTGPEHNANVTRDDETCLKLGREVVRMIHELRDATQGERGYSSRKFTYPGGAVHIFIANDDALAALFDAAAASNYAVESVTPPSQMN